MKTVRAWLSRFFSPGALVILLLAIISSVVVVSLPVRRQSGIPMWVYSPVHLAAYLPMLDEWNRTHPGKEFNIQQLQGPALERRMLSGFLAGTPVADMLEPHLGIAAKAFLGPLNDVGFVDLTSRLKKEGLLDQINGPSFAPYTMNGRIFGLPHDVHPVLLAYRSDLVEAADIDVSSIETWDDYFRVMRPLMKDLDGDGRPDRYLLTAWDTRTDTTIMLLLQAGGRYFDENNRPTLNEPFNAAVIARLVTWFTGPGRVCVDVETFTASGHRQRLDGVVIGTMVPDWMAGQWKAENPGLGGKLKLMPLPAWQKGGRRTSVAGGSMLGITKTSTNIETCWEFAKFLYLSPKLAEYMFRETSIISPVKALWSQPFYDEPDPYFCGQPSGRLYIQQAPDVPARPSSPYNEAAGSSLASAVIDLRVYADKNQIYDAAALQPEA
ncbi:MAG: extracellular solute-binding protein, partial [Opitutaceae bacterium]|nr:extracellular solute-binding protein [Opitutaceae bacterium]